MVSLRIGSIVAVSTQDRALRRAHVGTQYIVWVPYNTLSPPPISVHRFPRTKQRGGAYYWRQSRLSVCRSKTEACPRRSWLLGRPWMGKTAPAPSYNSGGEFAGCSCEAPPLNCCGGGGAYTLACERHVPPTAVLINRFHATSATSGDTTGHNVRSPPLTCCDPAKALLLFMTPPCYIVNNVLWPRYH